MRRKVRVTVGPEVVTAEVGMVVESSVGTDVGTIEATIRRNDGAVVGL